MSCVVWLHRDSRTMFGRNKQEYQSSGERLDAGHLDAVNQTSAEVWIGLGLGLGVGGYRHG